MPTVVKNAIRSPEAGKFIPVTVITDSEIHRVVAVIPYIRDPAQRVAEIIKIRDSISH